MSKYESIAYTLSAAVGAGGSFTVSYPAGKSADDYLGGTAHFLVSDSIRTLFAESGDIAVVFGASNISVTLIAGAALADGANVYLNIDRGDVDSGVVLADPAKMSEITIVKIALGTPATADADGIALAQARASAGNLTLSGVLATGGVATFDVPRNVVVVSSAAGDTTQTATFTGKDAYGKTVVETLTLNGTTPVVGKKAFKTISQVAISAALAGNGSAGSGVILGLPVFIADTVDVLKEIMDAAVATAGTLVAGVNATATATTGDVRGTYNPNSAPNGARVYELIAAVRAPGYKGLAQFAG